MVVSLHDIPKGSLVHHFITSGKPGKCELCRAFVNKLEAHHVCYDPEKTIKLCHNCHHKVHFWPQRLSDEEKVKLLMKRFSPETSQKIISENVLGISALSKLIAPSRNDFVRDMQRIGIKRIERPESDRKELLIKKPKIDMRSFNGPGPGRKSVKQEDRKLFKEKAP